MLNYQELIAQAIKEDIADGDHTTLACIPGSAKGKAHLLVKEEGILAGMSIAKAVFRQIDPDLVMDEHLKDGAEIKPGDIAFEISGSSASILSGERLALNYMQRMSGIATHSRRLVNLVKHTNCKILDSRKTTPNNRIFEKMAVVIGGAYNHRFGLYDMMMIKDNHIDYAGGIAQAIKKCKDYLIEKNLDLKIEIEARDLNELDEILNAQKVDRIMLDNFNYEDLRKAVDLIGDYAETEASGGITEETIADYAACGVDFISVGALTHQINSLDLSLKAIDHE
jgi:nicotinate-nucleotide pyrophosphorylase (carboxylating)